MTLRLSGVSHSYGATLALDDLTMEVGQGEIHGFLGPNGAGKSTAMRIMMGISSPTSGSLSYLGRPLTRTQSAHFGFMPEQRGLYPRMRVIDQLVLFARLRGLRRDQAATAASRWIVRLALQALSEKRVEQLSHGNQQRVQLAVCLVHQPRVVLLDEPFSGMDPVVADVVSDVIKELAQAGTTILLSSHQLDLVERICQRVTIISSGRTVVSGSVEQLVRDAGTLIDLDVETAAPDWFTPLPGIELVTPGATTTVSVAPGATCGR